MLKVKYKATGIAQSRSEVLVYREFRAILCSWVYKVILCTIAIIAFLFCFSFSVNAMTECKETDPNLFFNLLNSPVDPYLPARDRNGNTLLSKDEVFVQKSQHYFQQYKDFEPVSISMERFAAITEGNDRALENFESKINVIGPGCFEINLYRNRLVGSFSATFDEVMEIVALGQRSGNNALIQFASRQLKPKEMTFSRMIAILGNDLALDENVIRNMLSEDLRRQFVVGDNIPLRSLSEMALLAFSSMGGKIKKEIEKAFIFVPKSFRGIEPEPETIMLTSKGQIFGLAGFDYDMAAKVLNRLGVRTHVVTLSEVHTENSGSCSIDMARTWMQIVEGQKVRSCPFPELVRKMLLQRSYKNISDFKNKSVVFESIGLALDG